MHYFQFDIAPMLTDMLDFNGGEAHLYLKMICRYYLNEEPLPSDFDHLCRMFNCRSKTDKKMLQKITELKFSEVDGFFRHKKADEVIRKYKEKGEKNSKNGTLGGLALAKKKREKSEEENNESYGDRQKTPTKNQGEDMANLRIKEFSNLEIKESNNLTEDLREDTERAREESDANASEPVAKAPVSKSKKPKKIIDDSFDFRGELIARGVEPENADTWIAVRAAKKAINNLVAIKLLEAQAAIAGMTTNDAVMTAAGSGWAGFKAAWVKDDAKLSQPRVQFKSASERRAENNRKAKEDALRMFREAREAKERGEQVDPMSYFNV